MRLWFGSAHELPGEEVSARPGLSGEQQGERVRGDRDRHDRERDQRGSQPHADLRREREERVDGTAEDHARLLREHREAHRRPDATQPERAARAREADQRAERDRREERLGAVEQHLAADDDVVRHEREHGRCDEPHAHAVEQASQLERREHAERAEHDRRGASEPVALVKLVADRHDGLEEQRVRPEDREERSQLAVVRDSCALARVDRLVAVVADVVEVPEAHHQRDGDDAQEQRGGQQTAAGEWLRFGPLDPLERLDPLDPYARSSRRSRCALHRHRERRCRARHGASRQRHHESRRCVQEARGGQGQRRECDDTACQDESVAARRAALAERTRERTRGPVGHDDCRRRARGRAARECDRQQHREIQHARTRHRQRSEHERAHEHDQSTPSPRMEPRNARPLCSALAHT